jgi:hypothetical protein
MPPWFLAGREEPAIYGCLDADRYGGNTGQCKGRVEGVSIVVLEDM